MKTLLIGLSALALMPWAVSAQDNATENAQNNVPESASVSETEWQVPHTEHGQPDLQGIWNFGSATPFERPNDLGDQLVHSEESLEKALQQLQQREVFRQQPLDADRPAPRAGATIGIEAEFDYMVSNTELVPVNGEYRTSLIVSPVDGQMPINEDFEDFYGELRASGHKNYSDIKAMVASERCLIYAVGVPSLYPMPWNAHLQIVQNKDYVVLHSEMIHDARIVKLNQEAASDGFAKWLGDSVGYWEEDTLVVKTRNFRPEQTGGDMLPMSEAFELTEWFTPVSEDEILYRLQANDSKALTEPVIIERIIQRTAPDVRMYEFACHEGNYSLGFSLIGARHDDLNLERMLDEITNSHLDDETIAALEGEWTGEVNGSKLEFRFLKGNNGGLHLLLDLPAAATRDIVLSDVISDGSSLSFSVPSLIATFSGNVGDDSIVGTWTRNENPLPLTLLKE